MVWITVNDAPTTKTPTSKPQPESQSFYRQKKSKYLSAILEEDYLTQQVGMVAITIEKLVTSTQICVPGSQVYEEVARLGFNLHQKIRAYMLIIVKPNMANAFMGCPPKRSSFFISKLFHSNLNLLICSI